MNILYLSISGNTRAFAKHIAEYAEKQHADNPEMPEISLKEIHENSPFEKESEPFFTFVPTYLDILNMKKTTHFVLVSLEVVTKTLTTSTA